MLNHPEKLLAAFHPPGASPDFLICVIYIHLLDGSFLAPELEGNEGSVKGAQGRKNLIFFNSFVFLLRFSGQFCCYLVKTQRTWHKQKHKGSQTERQAAT